jgi:hypothetical protein
MSAPLSKHQLQRTFPLFAKTAIKKFDDGYELSGKFVRVAMLDNGDWDIFIGNTKNLVAGLGTGKLNNILNLTQPYPPMIAGITRLDGEAYFQSNDIVSLTEWLVPSETGTDKSR